MCFMSWSHEQHIVGIQINSVHICEIKRVLHRQTGRRYI